MRSLFLGVMLVITGAKGSESNARRLVGLPKTGFEVASCIGCIGASTTATDNGDGSGADSGLRWIVTITTDFSIKIHSSKPRIIWPTIE